MVHRFALLLGGVGAAAVLALAMNLGGLFSAAPMAADTSALSTTSDQVTAPVPDTTKTVIDKVYVEPTPDVPVIHVNKPPKISAPAPTVTRTRGEAEHGERGDRGERGDD